MKKLFFIGLSIVVLTQCKQAPTNPTGNDNRAVSQVNPEPSYEGAKTIAISVQAKLGKTLQEKLKQQGITGAIAFCNANALPITDSIAQQNGVQIRRVTDRARNKVNQANRIEIALMNQVRDSMLMGSPPGNLTIKGEAGVSYYVPIVTADFCLKCHGFPGKEINQNDYDVISRYYPEDKAIGYGAPELRGLWKVTDNSK
ncbi:MAG: hypothetical protein RLZZ241_2318 [Bacteroidota bacterium]|jgi:hypothetical protein